jgi:hypothetical protein
MENIFVDYRNAINSYRLARFYAKRLKQISHRIDHSYQTLMQEIVKLISLIFNNYQTFLKI